MPTGLLDNLASRKRVQLVPALGSHWHLTWPCVAVVGWFALVFLLINHTPLGLADTWRHANAGHWTGTHGVAANELPGVPLSQGGPRIADSWLFDVVANATAGRFGPEAVSSVVTVSLSIALWFWSWLIYRNSHSVIYVLFSAVVISVVWSTDFGVFHPRTFSTLIMAVLFCVLTPTRPLGRMELDDEEEQYQMEIWRWLAAILLFALWANIHISFVVGLSILLVLAVGNAIDGFLQEGFYGLTSRNTLRWVFLLQFCCLATLLTPHHVRLWHYCVTDGAGLVVRQISQGHGMYLPTIPGATMLGLLFFVVWRFAQSKTRRCTSEVLLFLLTAVLTAIRAQNLFWLAPVAMLIGSRHWLTEVEKSKLTRAPEGKASQNPLRFAATLTCLLFIWLGFALAPISAPILGGDCRSHDQLFATEVPREVSIFLGEKMLANDAQALVWAPADWADWLLWDGPGDLQVFTNSALDRMPEQVQSDYARIFEGEPGWERLLDQYSVGLMVIDKKRQPTLIKCVSSNPRWKPIFES